MLTKYTWVITRDIAPLDATNLVFKKGPSGAAGRASLSEVVRHGERFRLLDSLGEPKISGYIVGEYTGLEPLEQYGRQHDCVSIEYERNGEWVRIGKSDSKKSSPT